MFQSIFPAFNFDFSLYYAKNAYVQVQYNLEQLLGIIVAYLEESEHWQTSVVRSKNSWGSVGDNEVPGIFYSIYAHFSFATGLPALKLTLNSYINVNIFFLENWINKLDPSLLHAYCA